jgi:hypothetical protein
MKKLVFTAILALAAPMFGQVTVSVPSSSAPVAGNATTPAFQQIIPAASTTASGVVKIDGVTTTLNSQGQLVCSGGLPTGLTFDGTTFTAPKISTTQLTLTGGTTYTAGNYLVSISSTGVLTYTPYVPSTGSSPLIGLVQVPALAAYAKYQTTVSVPGAIAPTVSGSTVTGMAAYASPINPPTPSNNQINGYYNLTAWVSSNGVVSFYFNDNGGSARPAQNWIIKVQ